MNVYMVGLQLTAMDTDELLARIHGWEIGDDEGVITITQQPEVVSVPDDLQPPPANIPPAIPPTRPSAIP